MIMATDSPFYRVSIKALIFDPLGRLLVFEDKHGQFEIPGGGWEHGETMEECITRELYEEMQIIPERIGTVSFMYVGVNEKGYHKLRIAVPVAISTTKFSPSGDELVAASYVSRHEIELLSFAISEAPVLQYLDKIWPSANS
jgi:8-oxo-dGTP pyrophosphatase MutT (NUDIX family)